MRGYAGLGTGGPYAGVNVVSVRTGGAAGNLAGSAVGAVATVALAAAFYPDKGTRQDYNEIAEMKGKPLPFPDTESRTRRQKIWSNIGWAVTLTVLFCIGSSMQAHEQAAKQEHSQQH